MKLSVRTSNGPRLSQAEEIEHFRTIEWCKKLIDSPRYTAEATPARDPKIDFFFGETMNRPEVVPHCLRLVPKPTPVGDKQQLNEIILLVSLASGVDGYHELCHGGVVSVLFDEAFGNLMWRNHFIERPRLNGASVTASLTTKFLQAVKTPCTVKVTARLTRLEGRRRYLSGMLQDGDGIALASAEGLFIAMPQVPVPKL